MEKSAKIIKIAKIEYLVPCKKRKNPKIEICLVTHFNTAIGLVIHFLAAGPYTPDSSLI